MLPRASFLPLSQVSPGQVESKEEEKMDDGEIVKIENADGAGVLPHATKSRKGMVPYNTKKVNQDRGIVHYAIQNDPAMAMWGVMDGHGEFGHLVAAFIQEKLPGCLNNQVELKSSPEKSITEAVKRLCDDLTDTNINVAFSGSTCVFGVKVSDMLYVANVSPSNTRAQQRCFPSLRMLTLLLSFHCARSATRDASCVVKPRTVSCKQLVSPSIRSQRILARKRVF
jgi:hypothetical protein